MTLTEAVAALTTHRDQTYPDWCRERGMLNFALAVLKQIETPEKEQA